MSGPRDERPEMPALDALVALQRDAARPRSAAELDRGLAAVRARVAADRLRRPLWLPGLLVTAAVVLLAVALPRAWHFLRAPSTAVVVQGIEGGSLLDGGYLAQSGRGGVTVTFNEGTRVQLAPGTRGWLRELRRDGAALSIENGAASFQVTPDRARRWSVEAGPFLVTVKGTVFDVAWDPTAERFDLTLRRGRVEVTGPVVGGGIVLRAGQHLAIRLPLAETTITEIANERPAPPEAPAAAGAAAGPAAPARAAVKRPVARFTPEAAAPRSKQADARGWQAWLAAGQWDRILADAEQAGVAATLEQASSEDLFALADVARYRHRADLARAALLAERRRFPSSPRALDAIFLLGRVAEVRDGTARAVALYDEYLARAPDGPYAGEALGRKMILANDQNDHAQARAIARQYLLRFPSGSYAAAARALTREP